MAAKEMYDYLDLAAPDDAVHVLGSATYPIAPQGIVIEKGFFSQTVHMGEDGSEERITLSDDAIFYVTMSWEFLTAAEAGYLYAFFYEATWGLGMERSFQWQHPDDGHTYVIRFDCDLNRQRIAYDVYGVMDVRFRVLGRIAD
jgi:hypothetical protein